VDMEFIDFTEDEDVKQAVAERFVTWLEDQVVQEARGDDLKFSEVDPTGRFWLGRLGPKDFVTLPDERGDRLEPCAIGVRLRPANVGPWIFSVTTRFSFWKRSKSEGAREQRWQWNKIVVEPISIDLNIPDLVQETIHGTELFAQAFATAGGAGLQAQIRVKVTGRSEDTRALEVTLVNTGPETDELGDGRLFECRLSVHSFARKPFVLEALPDSFRFDRRVEAFGINCGTRLENGTVSTSDSPAQSRKRPVYWAGSTANLPDMKFASLSVDPVASASQVIEALKEWSGQNWSESVLNDRSVEEKWSLRMREEAAKAATDFGEELSRISRGLFLLQTDLRLAQAFKLMNQSMAISSKGRYSSWRPFQFAFLLANLQCLVDDKENEIVDVVWFATGGGKTETYLGLLLTAAFLDRLRGKLSGITAWSRFPLRMLSLQQTQRFANALAAAESVRTSANVPGDMFSLGFLVGGSATPNKVKKDGSGDDVDADKLEDEANRYLLLEICPFCRQRGVRMRFDRASWRLLHECPNPSCESIGRPLPIHIVDDEIWRFLPTIVIGTLDKAANIARQTGMRGILGPPWGVCSKSGHGYTYARRKSYPNGCLVPDCRGGDPLGLPIEASLYGPSFRLQDELHLLRDSLGAVDAHYECALDSLQEELTGRKPKVLASSATLSGYQKQIEVLYRREARVFPQPSPREGGGFWTSDSERLMRRYAALAPRRLTVEFVADRIIVTLQGAVRRLISDTETVCAGLSISQDYRDFLVDLYGTNVVYGNTLQDIDAVVRSSETQYSGLTPTPKVATLTGKTDFESVRQTLDRLENPEADFGERLHLIAASSMMSHGVDINRLNIMLMLAFPLGVAEFIQATARVGRQWPALVIVVPKMTRERDASLYRSFPEFITHGDRFVEPIPITRKSRRVLERTIAGLEMARITLIHEPEAPRSLILRRDLNALIKDDPSILETDRTKIAESLGLTPEDEFLGDQLDSWFDGFRRNLAEPTGETNFISQLSPTGPAMTSLRDVEEQVLIKGDSER
jgi:Helicase conserved C-terminal domain